jgi:hypothetical protein
MFYQNSDNGWFSDEFFKRNVVYIVDGKVGDCMIVVSFFSKNNIATTIKDIKIIR